MSNYSPVVDSGTTTPSSATGYVVKNDRHMQLINSRIYEQQAQARSKAIEETRKAKALQRNDREVAKVNQYLDDMHPHQSRSSTSNGAAARPQEYQIMVQDIPFRVVKGGSKLARATSETYFFEPIRARVGLPRAGDPNLAKNTPKKAVIGGVTFLRSRNGNLYRLGAVKSKRWVLKWLPSVPGKNTDRANNCMTIYRRGGPVKKKNELCKRFTSMGNRIPSPYVDSSDDDD